MTDPDDNPVPRGERYGPEFWLAEARRLLGPRRNASKTRWSLREGTRTEEAK